MIILAIQHQVRDYEAWKAVFDEFPPKVGGALFHRVSRGLDDPNQVVIEAGFPSGDAARAFTLNPALSEKMKQGGVEGMPRVEMYEEVEAIQY